MHNPKSIASASATNHRSASEAFDFRFNQPPNEQLFVDLCGAYAAYGGVAWGEDLARRMTDWRPELPTPSLARLIAAKALFHFRWRGATWVPMVQFDLEDLSIKSSIRQVRRQLGERQDGWEAASWFVRPSDALRGRRPVDVVDRNLAAVVQAARRQS